MIRLTLRQFRTQGLVAVALLVLVAIMLASTGSHLAKLYADFATTQAACGMSHRCLDADIDIGKLDKFLELLGTALVAVPGLIGAFWGAPLISRELEQGTHRLVWTQSVTRTRWLAVKLAIVGAASVAVTGLLSLMVTWWSAPIDRFDLDRFNAGLFGERNITPLGYAAFAFVLGVAIGLLVRRTLPAMAATLAAFLAVRLTFTYAIRQHLLRPEHLDQSLGSVVQGFGTTNGGPPALFANPDLPNAWIYSTRIVDGSGHAMTSQVLAGTCPDLLAPLTGGPANSTVRAVGPVPGGPRDALTACVDKLSPTYHAVITYQPASRYWILQSYETAVFAVAAIALAGLCFFWIRRRA